MEPITSTAGLKMAIQRLEVEQELKRQNLQDQFYDTVENLKPINILKRAINHMSDSPFLIENILGNAVGLIFGFISKKIVIGTSANIFRKLIGSIVQISISNSVKQHPETIKSIVQFIFQHLFRQKAMNSTKT